MSSFVKDVGDIFNPKQFEKESRRHGGRLRSVFDLGITSGVKSLSKSLRSTPLSDTATTSANTVMAAERSERERGGRTRQSSTARRRSATALSGGDTLKLSKSGLLGINL